MPKVTTAIVVRGLSVVLDRRVVLENIGFELQTGSRTVLTGPNGAGKTTLLKALAGLIPRAKGEVQIQGTEEKKRRVSPRSQLLGYGGQQLVTSDFPITAGEVVAIGAGGRGGPQQNHRITTAMESTRCVHLAERPFAHLSGGERQRVTLARCLAQGAQVLLFDEPAASLDPQGKADLLELLTTLSRERGLTILMASHEAGHFSYPGWTRLHIEGGRLVDHWSDPDGAAATTTTQ